MNNLKGKVISTKMTKTVVVKVTSTFRHPKYKKLMKRNNSFKAHSEKELKVGDVVTIHPCKRRSKDKYFEVI